MKLSDLNPGDLVKDSFGEGTMYNSDFIIWRVLEHGHTGDPTGSTALECRDIISLKCFDAKEPNNSDTNRAANGNNRYLYSNILQWLNSDAVSNWYTPQHTTDQAPDSADVWMSNSTPINPYDTESGFLTNFSSNLKQALQTVSKTTVKSTTDGGGSESVSSKVFLLSTTEVGLANENSIAEGSIYSLYNSDSTKRVKTIANAAALGNYSGYSVGQAIAWLIRTPLSTDSYRCRLVTGTGTLDGGGAAYVGIRGVSPAICISSDLEVALDSNDNVYYIVWPTVPDIKKVYVKDSNGKTKCIQNNVSVAPFASATDAQINAMMTAYYNGDLSIAEMGWNFGDTRTVALPAMAATGVGESHVAQTVTYVILNVDNGVDAVTNPNYNYQLVTPINGHTRPAFIIGQKDILANGNTAEYGYMNGSPTNSGSWPACARRTWCNDVYYNAIPSDFRSLIKQVTVKTGVYNASTIVTSNDYIFLLGEREILDSMGSTSQAEYDALSQLDYYKTASNRIKYAGSTASPWRGRSPYYIRGTAFLTIKDSGGWTQNYANESVAGYAPVFCI